MAKLSHTAHRIDREPVLFLGCTGKELGALAVLGAVFGLLVGILLGFLIGYPILILPMIFICAALFIWKGGKMLMFKKEGKPDGYYNRLLLSSLTNNFVKRTGYWSIRR